MGRVIGVTNRVEGESDNGQPWVKETLVIEPLDAKGDKRQAFEYFGEDKVVMLKNLQKGQLVEVYFDIQCREVKDDEGNVRWYTTLKGYGLRTWSEQQPAKE